MFRYRLHFCFKFSISFQELLSLHVPGYPRNFNDTARTPYEIAVNKGHAECAKLFGKYHGEGYFKPPLTFTGKILYY